MECQFCHQGQEAVAVCGTLHSVNNEKCYCVAHQRCMQYSSKLTQFRFDSFGGFHIEDVEEEIKRGKKLRCHICKKTGATVGCAYEKCNKTFHFPCAAECSDVRVLRFKKCDSQDANQLVFSFCVFCGDSHKTIYMQNSNLVDADCDHELSFNRINEDFEYEKADDSVESNGSISVLQGSFGRFADLNFSQFDFSTPDIDENAVDYDRVFTSAACNECPDVLSSAFPIGKNSVIVNPMPASASGENANNLGLVTTDQQTSTETSCEMISASESNCTMAFVDAASATTTANAANMRPSTIVATCAEASATEATITFSPLCFIEDGTVCRRVNGFADEIANSFDFNYTDLSQSQSCMRRDRLCLRSTQKRRREKQANEEVLYCRSPSCAGEVAGPSLVQKDPEPDKVINAPIGGTGEEMDFNNLPDPFPESPKKKSNRKNESVSTQSLRKASRQNVSISRKRTKESGIDHSQRLITSMLPPVKRILNFDIEAPVPGQKEQSPTANGISASSTNENFQVHLPVDVVPKGSLHIQSLSTAGGIEDPTSTVSLIRLDCFFQETENVKVERTALKVFEVGCNGTDMPALFDDDDSCKSSSQDWDTNSIDLLDLIRKKDAIASKGHCDDSDDVDDGGDYSDVCEVLRSNFSESFTCTFCQEDDMEIDQVCAICIPVSEEPLDAKTSRILLKHAICKLGLVEGNVFSWQVDGYRKIAFLKTILQCSEYLRDKNDKKLMETLFKDEPLEALLDSEDGDSSNKKFVEKTLSTIDENFKIAKQKYGTFMGELFSDPSLNVQAAFIVLNKLDDHTLTARSCLPRIRVHICDENTQFTIPFCLTEAQKKMILNIEYKNLKWCLENWFDFSTVLIYPNDSELRIQNMSSLSNCIGTCFKQHMVPGGRTYFVFIYRTDPTVINYRLFVCKMLAFVKEELVTLNHDVCIVFDVGSEVGITSLSDVVTSSFSESSAGYFIEVQVFAGVNPKYSPVSCLLIHLSLQDQQGVFA